MGKRANEKKETMPERFTWEKGDVQIKLPKNNNKKSQK